MKRTVVPRPIPEAALDAHALPASLSAYAVPTHGSLLGSVAYDAAGRVVARRGRPTPVPPSKDRP